MKLNRSIILQYILRQCSHTAWPARLLEYQYHASGATLGKTLGSLSLACTGGSIPVAQLAVFSAGFWRNSEKVVSASSPVVMFPDMGFELSSLSSLSSILDAC